MDLIYTNEQRIDQGVLTTHAFDLSFGSSENNFELTLGTNQQLEPGAILYVEDTEYGGIVDGLKTTTGSDTVTYLGRTWHGILNSKVIMPDSGKDYFTVSGNANTILSTLIRRLGVGNIFLADETPSAINIPRYNFPRYILGYDGIRGMLEKYGAKLSIKWIGRNVVLSVVPAVDYTRDPVDDDMATLTIEHHQHKVNHLVCLGRGELAQREVIHLYVNQVGNVVGDQYYTELDEIVDIYDNSTVESYAELKSEGTSALLERRGVDKAEITVNDNDTVNFDIGDIVGATYNALGVSVAEIVTQKIVKINNGTTTIEYKTGGGN